MSKPPQSRQNPYIGARPFKIGETLHGRDKELHELLDLFIAERIVLLYSPSGAGKTSLIQASLIPALKTNKFKVQQIVRVNHDALDDEIKLRPAFNRYAFSVLLSLEEALPADKKTPLAELADSTILEYIRRMDTSVSDRLSNVIIFDQFEEVLTVDPTDQKAKDAFFAQLGDALSENRLWALFAMREDFVAALDPYLRRIPTRFSTTYRLDLLGVEAAMRAVQRPADGQGVHFHDDAAEKLVSDLRTIRVQRPDGTTDEQPGSYVEPVQLQVVCSRLWENLPKTVTQITEEQIKSFGDVNQALAGYYEDRVKLVAAASDGSERHIREWFNNALITEQGIRGQVLYIPGNTQGLADNIVWSLVDAHLVRAEKRRGATWFELAHDRLIGPVLTNNAEWLQKHLNDFQRQAQLWERERRPDRLLLHGQALDEGEVWSQTPNIQLTPTEQDFLNECRQARTQIEKERIQLIEQAERDRKHAKRFRRLAYLTSLVSIVSVFLLIWALTTSATLAASYKELDRTFGRLNKISEVLDETVVQKDDALEARNIINKDLEEEKRKLEKTTGELIVQRDKARDAQNAAVKYAQVADSRRKELFTAYENLTHEKKKKDIAYTTLDKTYKALTIANAETVAATKLATENADKAEKGEKEARLLSQFNEAQEQAARAEAYLDSGRAPETKEGIKRAIQSVKIILNSYDKNKVEYKNDPETMYKGLDALRNGLNAVKKSLPASLMTVSIDSLQQPSDVTFSQNDSVVIASETDKALICAIETGQPCESQDFSLRKNVVREKVSLGNRILRDPLSIFDPAAGFHAGPGEVSQVAFSGDGKRVAFGRDNGKLAVGELDTGKLFELSPHRHGIHSVALNDDGNLLVSSTNLFSFKVMDVDRQKTLWKRPKLFSWLSVLTSRGKNRLMTALAFTHQNEEIDPNLTGKNLVAERRRRLEQTLVATSDQYGCTSIRRIRDGKTLLTLPSVEKCKPKNKSDNKDQVSENKRGIHALAFSPKNDALAVADASGRVIVWEVPQSLFEPSAKKLVGDAKPIYTLSSSPEGHQEAVLAVKFSPDGKLLATASQDRTVKVWDAFVLANQKGKDWDETALKNKVLSPLRITLTTHKGFINDISFDRSSQLLATAGADNTIKIWKVSLLPQLHPLQTKLALLLDELAPHLSDADKRRDPRVNDLNNFFDNSIKKFLGDITTFTAPLLRQEERKPNK